MLMQHASFLPETSVLTDESRIEQEPSETPIVECEVCPWLPKGEDPRHPSCRGMQSCKMQVTRKNWAF